MFAEPPTLACHRVNGEWGQTEWEKPSEIMFRPWMFDAPVVLVGCKAWVTFCESFYLTKRSPLL